LANGIDAQKLIDTQDAMALKVVEIAQEEHNERWKKQTYAHKYYAGWQAVLAHAGCFLRRIWVEDKEAWYGGMAMAQAALRRIYLVAQMSAVVAE
jgi:hypothetical protein